MTRRIPAPLAAGFFSVALFFFVLSAALKPAAAADQPAFGAPAAAVELEGPDELKARIESGFYGQKADEPLVRLARMLARRGDLEGAASAAARVVQEYPSGPFVNDALFLLASARYVEGAFDEARSLFARVEGSSSAPEEMRRRARSAALDIDGMKRPSVPEASIGALLPLKGQYASFGEGALKGVLLASGAFGAGERPVEVLVADPGADPRAAGALVDGFAASAGVVGIVGPLLGNVSLDAALHAQKNGVPIVTLTQREGVTSAGRYAFRIALRPADQASAVAAYAVKALGMKRFAVFFPQNGYGSELAALFRESVRRLGGTVAREASYAQGTRDFSREIQQFFEVTAKEKREGRRVVKEYEHKLQVDAVYIPDYHESVAMLLPYLEYYGVKDVKLLGSNGWNSQRLVEGAGAAAEGAVFADGFFASSRRPGPAMFAAAFTRAYSAQPGVIEAQAYDAAGVLLRASSGDGGARLQRRETMANLRAIADYEGAAGGLRFDEKGEAVKRVFVLGVKDGAIVELPDAPAAEGRR